MGGENQVTRIYQENDRKNGRNNNKWSKSFD